MTDTWGPPDGDGWPEFCDHCGKRKATGAIHTCPVPDVAGRDVSPECYCGGWGTDGAHARMDIVCPRCDA